MKTMKETLRDAYPALKTEFGYTNVMQSPRVEKVVISTGTGKIQDKQKLHLSKNTLRESPVRK